MTGRNLTLKPWDPAVTSELAAKVIFRWGFKEVPVGSGTSKSVANSWISSASALSPVFYRKRSKGSSSTDCVLRMQHCDRFDLRAHDSGCLSFCFLIFSSYSLLFNDLIDLIALWPP